MRKETCTICDKIVYVEDGEEFEWDPGAILCEKHNKFYCAEHKPCCALSLSEQNCSGIEEDDWEEDEGDEEEGFDDDDDLDIGDDEWEEGDNDDE